MELVAVPIKYCHGLTPAIDINRRFVVVRSSFTSADVAPTSDSPIKIIVNSRGLRPAEEEP